MQELGKFNFKTNAILNELKKYMNFNINNNLFFIDRLQFLISSLKILVKNSGKYDFKHLSQEFENDILDLVKQ